MSTHINSEGERIAIEDRRLNGQPCKCLVIYDDPKPRGTGQAAPMLLDDGTRTWLLAQLVAAAPPPTGADGEGEGRG